MAETIDHYTLDRSVDNQATWQRPTGASNLVTPSFNDSDPAGNPANAVNQTVFYKPTGITTPSGLEVPYDIGRLTMRIPGSLAWLAAPSIGIAELTPKGIARDNSGNLYATFVLLGSVNFGDQTLTSSGGNSVAVKYNSSGVCQWSFMLATGAGVSVSGIAVDSQGNILFCGSIAGNGLTADFGNGKTLAVNDTAFGTAFLVKFSPAKVCQWVVGLGTSGHDTFMAVALDASDNVVVTGVAGQNIVVRKYESDGDLAWTNTWSSGGGWGIAVDKLSGHVYVGATVQAGSNVGGGSLGEGFVHIKYSGVDGSHIWSKPYTNGGGSAKGVACDPVNGNVAFVGGCSAPLNFGGGVRDGVIGSGTGGGPYLVLYDSAGNHIASSIIESFTPNSQDIAYVVSIDAQHKIALAGQVFASPELFFGQAGWYGPLSFFVVVYESDVPTFTGKWAFRPGQRPGKPHDGSTGHSRALGVVISDGNVIVCGSYSYNKTCFSDTECRILTTANTIAPFVAAYELG